MREMVFVFAYQSIINLLCKRFYMSSIVIDFESLIKRIEIIENAFNLVLIQL